MRITYNELSNLFHLENESVSYVMKVTEAGHLMHVYWGTKIDSEDINYMMPSLLGRGIMKYRLDENDLEQVGLGALPQEFPSFGHNDMRIPAVELDFLDGNRFVDFKYHSYEIFNGKRKIEGLPSTYAEEDEAISLVITLKDVHLALDLELSYSIFKNNSAITRNVKLVNNTDELVVLRRILSGNVDIGHFEGDFLHLSGAWAKERHFQKTPLRPGLQAIESRLGSSSHLQNPWIGIGTKNLDEVSGSAYSMNLVYSGNFVGNVEVDVTGMTRMQIGINNFDFKWNLFEGESFNTPEVVLVYTDSGLNEMTNTYHNLYENNLIRGKFKHELRPVLINNWEATYFDFDQDRILELAKTASNLGVELLVLDDGWFGERHSDNAALGDWVVNENKLKNGLADLAGKVNDLGMKFGLWFEPEMISPNSDLYRKNPDWCIRVPHRKVSLGRQQLILDLSRDDVCDYVINAVSTILENANIEYVKWDYNREFSEIFSSKLEAHNQQELPHRYMLNLYRIMETITQKFPDVLFESCAGGGGRFDAGMLYYMPQIWASDDTDAIERLKIQHGTSLIYPSASMGCHVSITPNHQVGRMTPLQTRGVVAMSGNFGYEMDLNALAQEELEEIKEQIVTYKSIRNTVQFGTLTRLKNAHEGNEVAWMYTSKDHNQIVVNFVRQRGIPFPKPRLLKLRNIEKNSVYRDQDGQEYTSLILENIGLLLEDMREDYSSKQWILEKVSHDL